MLTPQLGLQNEQYSSIKELGTSPNYFPAEFYYTCSNHFTIRNKGRTFCTRNNYNQGPEATYKVKNKLQEYHKSMKNNVFKTENEFLEVFSDDP